MCVYISVPFYHFYVNPDFPNKKLEETEGSFKYMRTTVQFSILEKEVLLKAVGRLD